MGGCLNKTDLRRIRDPHGPGSEHVKYSVNPAVFHVLGELENIPRKDSFYCQEEVKPWEKMGRSPNTGSHVYPDFR